MTLLSAHNLGVAIDGRTILHGVHFAIERGEIVTIVGPNGSGKSTFIKALIGAIATSAGTVQRKAGLKIGYVPQRLHIDQTLPITVARFLSLPVRHKTADMHAMLERVGVAGIESRQMATLSGGQFQRVLLARALLATPDILMLDEPTQGLDQPGVAAFYLLVEEVRRDLGCAVLMVSHDLHVVMSASDRVICINGHICCEGEPHIVSEAPEYRELFGIGTKGALALYRHHHDHAHDCDHDHGTTSDHGEAAE